MNHPIRPRRPLFALLMSLVLPGFGQFYNGELNKAIWLFLGFALLSIPGGALVALYLPSGWMIPALVLGILLTLALWLYGMIDAWRGAFRRQDYVLRAWQLGGVYVLLFILCNVLALPLLINYVRTHQVASYYIPASSMAPSVLRGDLIFADQRYNCPGCKQGVKRGDIAIFVYPNNRTIYYIRRIIGLPGDRVRVRGDEVWVNGQSLTLANVDTPGGVRVTEHAGKRQWQVIWAPAKDRPPEVEMRVPAGRVFVLGDNRTATRDSRNFGTVSLRDVIGKARQVWFSRGADGVRWKRLGKVLR